MTVLCIFIALSEPQTFSKFSPESEDEKKISVGFIFSGDTKFDDVEEYFLSRGKLEKYHESEREN